MFFYDLNHALQRPVTKEYFSLAVQNIFLQVERNRFSHAIIFSVRRNFSAQIINQFKVLVYRTAAREYYSCIFCRINFQSSEFSCRNSFKMNKRFEINGEFMLPREISVGVFIILRLR